VAARTVVVELVEITCCACGAPFAMSEALYDSCREHNAKAMPDDTKTFYCPAGHSQHFTGRSTEQQLRRQVASLEEDVRAARADAQAARMREGKERRRAENVTKRADLGICPHCHRRVRQLADHVASKHPEHVPKPQPTHVRVLP
jgi:hypothetical protein